MISFLKNIEKVKEKIFFETEKGILINTDCLEILKLLPDKSIDLILTDPPYGIERFKKGSLRFDKNKEYENGIWWDEKPKKEVFDEMFRVSKYQIIWGLNNFTEYLPNSEYFFVWDKYQTVENFASAEIAYTNIKCPAKVFRYSIHLHNTKEKYHPTQKPVELFKFCLNYAKDVNIVMDCFLGSGTTALACEDLGINWIGIELETKYCDITKKRLLDLLKQPKLL